MAEPDYLATNRSHWEKWAHTWVATGEERWAGEAVWGLWSTPERGLSLLPADMCGMDAIELGCGTGYVSGWMARRGARVLGIDSSAQQLATARRLAAEHAVELELVLGRAEQVDRPDGSFDFAISEYGAAIWSDPYVWVPEAWRLLRPGGRLVLLGSHPFVVLVQDFASDAPATGRLINPYFGMHRIDWDDGEDQGTEFNLPISEWMALFDRVGFDVLAFHELRAPQPGPERHFFVTRDWGYVYPAEQVWKLRKREVGPRS